MAKKLPEVSAILVFWDGGDGIPTPFLQRVLTYFYVMSYYHNKRNLLSEAYKY